MLRTAQDSRQIRLPVEVVTHRTVRDNQVIRLPAEVVTRRTVRGYQVLLMAHLQFHPEPAMVSRRVSVTGLEEEEDPTAATVPPARRVMGPQVLDPEAMARPQA